MFKKRIDPNCKATTGLEGHASCGTLNYNSHKDIQVLTPIAYEYVTLHEKIDFIDGVQLIYKINVNSTK